MLVNKSKTNTSISKINQQQNQIQKSNSNNIFKSKLETRTSSNSNISLKDKPIRLFGVEVTPGSGLISIDIEKQVKKMSNQLQKDLNNFCQKNGVDNSDEINFKINSTGKIIISNQHPNKDKIEKLINDHDQLPNKFKELSHATYFRNHMREHKKFRALYKINPKLAVRKYNHLFSNQKTFYFKLIYKNGKLTKEARINYK